jgi:hypothetical protein
VLGDAKREFVAAIAAEPRNSQQREQLFFQMHDRLEAAATDNPALQDWSARLTEARQRAQDERVLLDRELFYAIQPVERLMSPGGRRSSAAAAARSRLASQERRPP